MKRVLSFLLVIASTTVNAENTGISIGAGMPYGSKLGVKYSIGEENTKFFAGAGLLAYHSETGAALGYSFGFDQKIFNEHHSLGGSFGTVDSIIYNNGYNLKRYASLGLSINYSYYFSGFNNKSWVIGSSLYSGKRDVPGSAYDKNISGFSLSGGYNF